MMLMPASFARRSTGPIANHHTEDQESDPDVALERGPIKRIPNVVDP